MEKGPHTKKPIWKWQVGALAAFVLFFSIWFVPFLIHSYKTLSSERGGSKDTVSFYEDLFNKDIKTGLKLLITSKNAEREPQSVYIYNGNKILVYRVALTSNLALLKTLSVKEERSGNIAAWHAELSETPFKTEIRAGGQDSVAKINIKFLGAPIKVDGNTDNAIYYYLNVHNFSIGFDDGHSFFLTATSSSEARDLPVEMAFIKKSSFVYIVVLTPGKETNQATFGILKRILKNTDEA